MKVECNCGFDYKQIGLAHCQKHHRDYPLLNNSKCPMCEAEEFCKKVEEAHKEAANSKLHFGKRGER